MPRFFLNVFLAQRASSYVQEATPSPNDYSAYRAVSDPQGEFESYANDYEYGDGYYDYYYAYE